MSLDLRCSLDVDGPFWTRRPQPSFQFHIDLARRRQCLATSTLARFLLSHISLITRVPILVMASGASRPTSFPSLSVEGYAIARRRWIGVRTTFCELQCAPLTSTNDLEMYSSAVDAPSLYCLVGS